MKWEYHTTQMEIDATGQPTPMAISDLDALGTIGWEVVTVWLDRARLFALLKRPPP
ncbi:MAG: hypothetical protein LH617_01970 [Ramlibacter sp.]|nr:hypothetical protein [Ramlibacter sp.]